MTTSKVSSRTTARDAVGTAALAPLTLGKQNIGYNVHLYLTTCLLQNRVAFCLSTKASEPPHREVTADVDLSPHPKGS